MSPESRPLTLAERARMGAAKRWADPASRRIVRIDELSASQRRLVLALVDAAKAEQTEKASTVFETPADAELEVRNAAAKPAA